MSKQLVPVSKRALYQRINRQLREERQILKASRGGAAAVEIGEYYVIDPYRNSVVLTHVSLVKLAEKLGVIQPWERLAG